MKMRKNIELIAILMAVLAACLFTACDGGAMEELWKDELGNAADGLFDGDNGGDGPTPPPAPGKYRVIFDVQGHGTAPEDKYVSPGEYVTEPTAPTAAGYTFGGWYKEAGCINEWNFSSDTVTADITLYAKWTQTVVSVTGVTLDPTELTITVGDQPVQLTATVFPDDAAEKSVNWSSNAESVATVDASGKVTAVAPGDATITVTTVDGSKTATCAVTVALPAGALAGVFSVSNDNGITITKIHFSQGNLWYGKVGSATEATFNFEDNQYDFRTYAGKGSCIDGTYNASSGTPADNWGLFGWSTASTTYGINTSTTNSDYSGDFKDWGTAIDNAGTWKTLTREEWDYLLNTRTSSTIGGTENARFAEVVVKGVMGMIIFPDEFEWTSDMGTAPTKINTYCSNFGAGSYDETQFSAMEESGCVFLPAAGYRLGSSVSSVGSYGIYWSATAYSDTNAYCLYFNDIGMYPGSNSGRSDGQSVRLVWCEN